MARSVNSLLLSIALSLALLATAHGQTSTQYVPGEVLVKYRKEVSGFQVQGKLTALKGRTIQNFERFGIRHVRFDQTTDIGQIIAALKADPDCEVAEPNYIIHLYSTIPDDPLLASLWGLNNTGQTLHGVAGTVDADIDAPEAWDSTTGSSSVIVAVIDSGIDYVHPDLAANIWINPGEIAGNGRDEDRNGKVDDIRGWDFANKDNDPFDDNGHGTHVAGIIGAVGDNALGVVGICWAVKMVPLKIFDANGSAVSSNFIAALSYALAKGIKLANYSGGGYEYSILQDYAIQQANESGLLLVVAAGNETIDNDGATPSYPASYNLPNIISVASTHLRDGRSSFSNYGATSVDLGAPGEDIGSTYPGNLYAYLSGTSMAAPHVTGAAALIWSHRPTLSHTQVKALLLASVDPMATLSGTTVTGGRLNIAGALSNQLVFGAQPSGSLSGAVLAVQPVIKARDIAGNTDETFAETVTLSLGSGAGSLSGTLTAKAVNGVATFSNVAYTATADGQSFSLSANDQDGVGTNLSSVTSNRIPSDVVATQLAWSTQPVGSASGAALTTQPVVKAVDGRGLIDVGFNETVTLSLISGAGSLSGTLTAKAVNGVAAFSNVAYTATADGQSFSLSANDQDGVGTNLSSVTFQIVVEPLLPGDFDADGLVDFDDFFPFADNFGKSGNGL